MRQKGNIYIYIYRFKLSELANKFDLSPKELKKIVKKIERLLE